jgi:hypothetical protein
MKRKQCKFIKKDSAKCTSFAMSGSDYCYRHNPDVSEENKHNASSEGGKQCKEPQFIETPLPEMKVENMQDVVNLLADTINNVRTGKISTKSGTAIGYLSFILMQAMDKVSYEKAVEEENKQKAEGKWVPRVSYPTKFYQYKDEFYLDKDGNPLIVEYDSIRRFPEKIFKPEYPTETKDKHKRHKSPMRSPDRSQKKNIKDDPQTETEGSMKGGNGYPDILDEDIEDQDKFYRESTAKIIQAVKRSGILDGKT